MRGLPLAIATFNLA